MLWFEDPFPGIPAASGAGGVAAAPGNRPEHWPDESLGIDVAPAMAFTNTMPGYVRAIDFPSTGPSDEFTP